MLENESKEKAVSLLMKYTMKASEFDEPFHAGPYLYIKIHKTKYANGIQYEIPFFAGVVAMMFLLIFNSLRLWLKAGRALNKWVIAIAVFAASVCVFGVSMYISIFMMTKMHFGENVCYPLE